MVALAALLWLPRWAIAGVAFIMIGGHNLLDGVRAEELGEASWAWHVLHEPGRVPLGDGASLYVLYPLIPWIGVMAAGYLLGPVMQLEPEARQRLLFRLGAAITLAFIVLRATNLYGDPAPWTIQETWFSTVLSFFNCEKYPPSLLYSNDDTRARADAARFLRAREGRVRPLACHVWTSSVLLYVVHIYLIHGFAVATGFALTGTVASTPAIGLSLPGIYFVWLLA